MSKTAENTIFEENGKARENEIVIPDKLYFKIGEVCEITGVKQHVLRYWESEFRVISPQRARSKQRLYRRVDVENILKIKRLLKNEGFTIPGAKKALANQKNNKEQSIKSATQPVVTPKGMEDFFKNIKTELTEIKELLEA